MHLSGESWSGKFSRFTPKREHAIIFKSIPQHKGIRVVSITEQAEDSATHGLFEGVDELQSENLIPVFQSKQTLPLGRPL